MSRSSPWNLRPRKIREEVIDLIVESDEERLEAGRPWLGPGRERRTFTIENSDRVVVNEDRRTPGPIDSWKNLESHLKCEACREFFNAPVSLKCGHVFCSFCVRKHLEFSAPSCPVCRLSATFTDFRLESRLAAILLQLREGNTRKLIRCALKGRNGSERTTSNQTFTIQSALESHSLAFPGESILREPLPVYKNLKLSQLVALLQKDGIPCDISWKFDDLVKKHKEFYFALQAATDGWKMGAFSVEPTRAAVAAVMLGTRKRKSVFNNPGLDGQRLQDVLPPLVFLKDALPAMRMKGLESRKRWLLDEETANKKRALPKIV